MDIENILTLIDAVSNSDINSFKYQEGDMKISLNKNKRSGHSNMITANPVITTAVPMQPQAVQPIIEQQSLLQAQQLKVIEEKETEAEGNEIKSPIVGTFYSAPGPDSPDFVKIGDKVKKGQVLCIIEAMKLMNEIESDYDGEIVDILVKNGQMVEYGQPLFLIKE